MEELNESVETQEVAEPVEETTQPVQGEEEAEVHRTATGRKTTSIR